MKLVVKMLKAIHAQEIRKAAREKAKTVVGELRSMKLKEAGRKVEDGIEETLAYCDFPSEHWTRIRTNNVIERLKGWWAVSLPAILQEGPAPQSQTARDTSNRDRNVVE